MTDAQIMKRNISIGIISTIVASILYPLCYYAEFHLKIEMLLQILFAISIALSSVGIYNYLKTESDCPSLITGLKLSLMAALIYALASTTQAALLLPLEEILVPGDQSFTYGLSSRIFIGIEFLWKILFGLGILFFSIALFKNKKAGPALGILGILFTLFLLITNYVSFPESPEIKRIFSIGPAITSWHLLTAILMTFSLKDSA